MSGFVVSRTVLVNGNAQVYIISTSLTPCLIHICIRAADHGATGALLGPCTLHMHQAPRLRNGLHFSASSIISLSVIYFHFDVFPLAFAIFFPVHTAIPLWIPKSPVDNTSGRFNANIKNISAPRSELRTFGAVLQRPIPRTSTSFSIMASSDSCTISSAFNRPSANRMLKSRTYSTFLPLNPAVLRTSGFLVRTWCGVGKNPTGGLPSSSTASVNSKRNLRVILREAALETC